MTTLGSTAIMRKVLKSGLRSTKSSVTRRLAGSKFPTRISPKSYRRNSDGCLAIENDLGGEELLSSAEMKLIDVFASISVVLDFVRAKAFEETKTESL